MLSLFASCVVCSVGLQALGAVDYLEICKNFDLILLRDVEPMGFSRLTEARRFITLIDTLYDNKVSSIVGDVLQCCPM